MNKKYWLWLVLGIAVFIFQKQGIAFFGAVPNLSLAFLLAVVFFLPNIFWAMVFSGIAGLILKFNIGFSPEILFIVAWPIIVFWYKDKLPSQRIFNFAAVLIIGFVGFYLVFAPQLITSIEFVKDFIISAIFAFITYNLFAVFSETAPRRFRHRLK